jgi:hypothetical protein
MNDEDFDRMLRERHKFFVADLAGYASGSQHRAHHRSMSEGRDTSARLPFIELSPWRARRVTVKKVSLLAPESHKVILLRLRGPIKNKTKIGVSGTVQHLRVHITWWRTVLHVLVAATVVAGIAAEAGDAALLLAVAWTCLMFCRNYTRSARGITNTGHTRRSSGFRYNLCFFGVLYLIPATIAIGFHVLLAIYLAVMSNGLSIDQLIGLEQAFAGSSKFFADNLKLNELAVLGLLIGVYIVSCVLLAKKPKGKVRLGAAKLLHGLADIYTKYSGPIAAGLATLAAFTMFGMQLGVPADDVRLRIKSNQQGYVDVTKRLEANFSQRVIVGLYSKIERSLPPDYQETLQRVLVTASASDLKPPPDSRTPPAEHQSQHSAPGDTTAKQLETARQVVDTMSRDAAIGVFRQGEKKAVLQVEKLTTEQLVNFTKPLTQAFPILEPMLQSLVEAVDKSLQDRLAQAYDRIVQALKRTPGDLDALVRHEADKLVADTDVSAPVADATQRIEPATNSQLIADIQVLGHTDTAARSLVQRGASLSSAQVDELVRIMRTTTDKSVKHNAAYVVSHIRSSYVSFSLHDEARGICGCRG